ncbi:hypothetical protein AAFF_G00226560 [Aldrovandia affinis]|uniref:Uncharacterized protein n=1 Tax=Aldrovandia affinis TaxID=143900 RepID=A0AAD7TCK0_9TELE|nr:hypothetical protein AAFF_G00226560 [Aldrovandia affinis]
MDLMTPQEQIRSLVEKIVLLIGERVTLTASTPRLVIKSILDNDGRIMMSPCTLNPSVAELIRLVEDLSSLAGISAHNMWLFMTWRAEVLNSHLLAFVTDVRAKKGLVGGLEKEVGGLEKEGAKAAAAMVNEVGGPWEWPPKWSWEWPPEVGVAIAQEEKMVPVEAGEPIMMMTTMYGEVAQMDLMSPQDQIRSLVEQIVHLIGERVTLTASTPRLVIKSILDNDGRIMMSPCTLNPSVAELIRLIEDLSSLAGISAHSMWLFMTWRAEVLNSHLLAFVTDVMMMTTMYGEVAQMDLMSPQDQIRSLVVQIVHLNRAIAQAEKMVPAEAGEPNMIPAEAGEPNMMMTTMYDATAAAEESGNTDGEGGLSVAEGQTLKGSWREASGSLATPVSSLKSPFFGRGLNAA